MRILKTALWTSAALLGLALVVAAPATADQVFLDDVIIDGSACVGFDCVNGESFGFDTIRLKENNLRIKFQDTSSSASFPSRDWQITANDSANGGLNKFSIDDIDGGRTPFTIEGNAPSHSLYVDDGGRLGLGTSIPVVDVHVKSGNTPTLRLEQDGSSGFAPQTWDVAGNEANFFIRDVTNGSTLPIRLRPGAPTSAIDIAASGNVGLGTASPAAKFHIENTSGDDVDDFVVTEDGKVGIGADTVGSSSLDIDSTGETLTRFRMLNGASAWNFEASESPNQFIINSPSVGGNELRLESDGDLFITGALTTTGATCNVTPCDALFDIARAHELESIEEHAASMWERNYLPGVGSTLPDVPMNLSEKTAGILNELEKAHIFIEQLNSRLVALEANLAEE